MSMLNIEENTGFRRFCGYMERVYRSNWFLLCLAALCCAGFLGQWQQGMIAIFAVVLSFVLVTSRDVTPLIPVVSLACIIPLNIYGSKFADYQAISWLIAVVALAFITHLVIFPVRNYHRGKMFFGMLAYSVALVLGGIGSITPKYYFRLTPLYYVLGCGFLALGIYVLFDAYVKDTKDLKSYYARIMAFTGLACAAIWISTYLMEIPKFLELDRFYFPYVQWKNNMGNFILLTMPFAFYLSTKSRYGWAYFVLGCAEYMAMMVSQCKGGMIVATALIPILIVLSFVYAPKKFYKYFVLTLAVFIGAGLGIAIPNKEYLLDKIKEYLLSNGSGRPKLYQVAWQNFLDNPVLGAGIGYINETVYPLKPMSMFWYHSTIFQVIGSMGIFGLCAYAVMMTQRLMVILRVRAFNVFLFVAFVGFEGYSMVNTGDFAPIPFVALLTIMLTVCEHVNRLEDRDKPAWVEARPSAAPAE